MNAFGVSEKSFQVGPSEVQWAPSITGRPFNNILASAMKSLCTTCFLVVLIISCANQVCPQTPTPAPILLTEENSSRAAALDSVTFTRDPIPVVNRNNRSNDRRTRVTLFGINMDLLPGENASAVTARARDSRSRIYNLNVESVGMVPGLNWLTQIVVKLPDQLAQAGDVSVSVTLHGQTSNEVIVNIEVQTAPRTATLLARKVINDQDNYVDATFSFEHGMNGEGALPFTRNDWDIEFGNFVDSFHVTMVVDDCSRIQDLGALNWSDAFQVPILTAYPVPTRDPPVTAIVGHMYVVHTKDTETDLYALFRVEALDPGKSVTISWKSVQTPESN